MPGPPFLPHNPPPWNSSEPALHLTVGIFHFRMLLFLAYFFYTQKFIFKWARVCVWGGWITLTISGVFQSCSGFPGRSGDKRRPSQARPRARRAELLVALGGGPGDTVLKVPSSHPTPHPRPPLWNPSCAEVAGLHL